VSPTYRPQTPSGISGFTRLTLPCYNLKIEKAGYVTRTIEAIDVCEKDVNLGDINLQRAPKVIKLTRGH